MLRLKFSPGDCCLLTFFGILHGGCCRAISSCFTPTPVPKPWAPVSVTVESSQMELDRNKNQSFSQTQTQSMRKEKRGRGGDLPHPVWSQEIRICLPEELQAGAKGNNQGPFNLGLKVASTVIIGMRKSLEGLQLTTPSL